MLWLCCGVVTFLRARRGLVSLSFPPTLHRKGLKRVFFQCCAVARDSSLAPNQNENMFSNGYDECKLQLKESCNLPQHLLPKRDF